MAFNSDSSVCSYLFYMNQASDALLVGYNTDPSLFIDVLAVPELNFRSQGIIISNDAAASVFFSLNGADDHGEILAGEVMVFDWIKVKQIWLRGASGGEAYRFWSW